MAILCEEIRWSDGQREFGESYFVHELGKYLGKFRPEISRLCFSFCSVVFNRATAISTIDTTVDYERHLSYIVHFSL